MLCKTEESYNDLSPVIRQKFDLALDVENMCLDKKQDQSNLQRQETSEEEIDDNSVEDEGDYEENAYDEVRLIC